MSFSSRSKIRPLLVALVVAAAASSCDKNGVGARGRDAAQLSRASRKSDDVKTSNPRIRTVPELPLDMRSSWTFTGYSLLRNVLTRDLQIGSSGTDPRHGLLLGALDERRYDLGATNYASGISKNTSPEPAKFKFLVELIFDACDVGLANPSVRSKLFPGVGAMNAWTPAAYDAIYLRFLGRYPASVEKESLGRLVADVSVMKDASLHSQQTSVCAAVLSSLEFTHGR